MCDTCVRIQVARADETLDPVARKALEDSKRVHVTEARAQRIGLKVKVLMPYAACATLSYLADTIFHARLFMGTRDTFLFNLQYFSCAAFHGSTRHFRVAFHGKWLITHKYGYLASG